MPEPDKVIYLTLSPEAAAARGTFGDERYEREEFQKKVSDNFEKLRDHSWLVYVFLNKAMFAWVSYIH